ncbi:MAG: hypothetical protein IKI20_00450 [Lachnospiraceae bacterium]|nr:hypothetical protein [Lachnospiraceae bacterium]
MKKMLFKKGIRRITFVACLITLLLILTSIKSKASIPNTYLTYSATWSGNKCTVTTIPDPPSDNPLLYANSVVFEYNSSGTLLGSAYDYTTSYNTNAIASVSKSGVYRARAVAYLTSGADSTGTSYGFESHYCLKGIDL